VNLPVRALASGVQFAVKAVPGASRDRIVGPIGEALKVQVAAPPESGKANARLCEVLARALLVPTSAVQVARGHGSSRKVVVVQGLSVEAVLDRLSAITS
jgi:uncharacterized protein (TIGR00251 family)